MMPFLVIITEPGLGGATSAKGARYCAASVDVSGNFLVLYDVHADYEPHDNANFGRTARRYISVPVATKINAIDIDRHCATER